MKQHPLIFLVILLISLSLTIFGSGPAARADEDSALKVYQDLCAGESAEGSYVATLGAAGKFRINIVCVSPSSLAASLRDMSGGNIMFSLVHTAVDDDTISFLTFHIAADDAKTMSAMNADIRLKLDLPSLRQGILKGSYKALQKADPIFFETRREAAFPNLLIKTNRTVDFKKTFPGSFQISAGPLKPDLTFIMMTDILGGIQRLNINFPGASGFVLHNGLSATNAGDVFYATSGVDDGASGRVNLLHIRGRILNPNEYEIYYLDTRTGLKGPLKAKRRF